MATIVNIASHVARGHVGNSVTVFSLQRLGHEVWHLPSVLLPFHPGHGPGTRVATPATALGAMLDDLATLDASGSIDAILTGYLGEPAQAAKIAAFIDAIRKKNPNLLYVCDPVLGDNEALYVDPALANAMKVELVPRADILTPNLFELGWLTDLPTSEIDECVKAARTLDAQAVFVTSAPALMKANAGMLAVTGDRAFVAEGPAIPEPPHGLGDLSAALILAHTLGGQDHQKVLRRTLGSVHDLAIQTYRRQLKEIPLAAEQHRLLQSAVTVQLRTLTVAP